MKYSNILKDEFVYRITIQYFTDIGNFPLKIDFKIKCHLELSSKN